MDYGFYIISAAALDSGSDQTAHPPSRAFVAARHMSHPPSASGVSVDSHLLQTRLPQTSLDGAFVAELLAHCRSSLVMHFGPSGDASADDVSCLPHPAAVPDVSDAHLPALDHLVVSDDDACASAPSPSAS